MIINVMAGDSIQLTLTFDNAASVDSDLLEAKVKEFLTESRLAYIPPMYIFDSSISAMFDPETVRKIKEQVQADNKKATASRHGIVKCWSCLTEISHCDCDPKCRTVSFDTCDKHKA